MLRLDWRSRSKAIDDLLNFVTAFPDSGQPVLSSTTALSLVSIFSILCVMFDVVLRVMNGIVVMFCAFP